MKRDRSMLPTINNKVSSICNKQHPPADVKPAKKYHAFKEKKENIFDVLLAFLKPAKGDSNTQASGKQTKH